jgi:hypothetical protein
MLRKKRSANQIKEEKSSQILRELLPETWVIHEYSPDYGIDYVVELFDYLDDDKKTSETLGELIFIQLKSSSSVKYIKKRFYARSNIEKGPLNRDKSDYSDLQVATFGLENSLIQTVRAMGPAVPVLLVLVDLNTQKAFFINLNDYIDKILVPEGKKIMNKGEVTLFIPLDNEIKNNNENGVIALRYYGKRAKMYGAFSRFSYQKHEINKCANVYNLDEGHVITINETVVINMLSSFIENALSQDIWSNHEFWCPIAMSFEELKSLKGKMDQGIASPAIPSFVRECQDVWRKLDHLSKIYEDVVREWFMPTYLSKLTSFQ